MNAIEGEGQVMCYFKRYKIVIHLFIFIIRIVHKIL